MISAKEKRERQEMHAERIQGRRVCNFILVAQERPH